MSTHEAMSQLQFGGMDPQPDEKVLAKRNASDAKLQRNVGKPVYDVGRGNWRMSVADDYPRFSNLPGQQVMDFKGNTIVGRGHARKAVPTTPEEREYNLREQVGAGEVDRFGFVNDPQVNFDVYRGDNGVGVGGVDISAHRALDPETVEQRTFGPDAVLRTRQSEHETARGTSITALRALGQEGWTGKPSVMRYMGEDVVIDGHHRIAAARRLGTGDVDVNYYDYDTHGPQRKGYSGFIAGGREHPLNQPQKQSPPRPDSVVRAFGDEPLTTAFRRKISRALGYDMTFE